MSGAINFHTTTGIKTLAQRFTTASGFSFTQANIVSEGGSLETDGNGLLLVTETSLINSNRNPGWSKQDIETELKAQLGVRKIVWLWGSKADAVTDGHVDGIAKFLAPGKLVIETVEDPLDPEYKDFQENLRRIKGLTDADEKPIEVVTIYRPRREKMTRPGNDFAASYVNGYYAHGPSGKRGIVISKFGDKQRDQKAAEVFSKLSGGAKIVQLRTDQIARGGGGIHCNTQQIPLV